MPDSVLHEEEEVCSQDVVVNLDKLENVFVGREDVVDLLLVSLQLTVENAQELV